MDSQIKKGAIASYISIALNIFYVLIYTPLLIRGLGTGDYAVYTLVYSFVNYFLIDFGIGSSVARFITQFRYDKNEKYTEEELVTVVFKTFFVLTIAVGFVLLAFYPHLDQIFKGLTAVERNHLSEVYKIAVIHTLIQFAATPLESIFIANEFFAPLKILRMIQKTLTVLLTLIILKLPEPLIWVMIVSLVSGVVAVTIEVCYLARKNAIQLRWTYWNTKLIKRILLYSVWMSIITLAQRFIIPITPTILGIQSTSKEISAFSVASTMEGYVFTFGAALNGLFLPKVSRIINAKKFQELNELQIKVGRIQLYIVGTILIGATIFGKEFISLWVGSQYVDISYHVFLLIAWSDIVYLTQEVSLASLNVIGEVKYRAGVYVCSAIISTSLSYCLASYFGAIGSAVGICICLWGFNVGLMTVVYNKKAHIDTFIFFKKCHLDILPAMLLYGVAWAVLNRLFLFLSWRVLIVKLLTFSIGLALILWCFALNTEEKDVVKTIIKKVERSI